MTGSEFIQIPAMSPISDPPRLWICAAGSHPTPGWSESLTQAPLQALARATDAGADFETLALQGRVSSLAQNVVKHHRSLPLRSTKLSFQLSLHQVV